jgi:hypothetical protein
MHLACFMQQIDSMRISLAILFFLDAAFDVRERAIDLVNENPGKQFKITL